MADFKYTNHVGFDSEWVEEAWYDQWNGDLVVNLEGRLYRYENVPKSVFDALVKADDDGASVGAAYNHELKYGGYGHAEFLGDEWNVVADYRAPEASPGVGMPKGLSRLSQRRTATYDLPKPDVASVPKTEAIHNVGESFSMRASRPTEPRWVVTFEVNGDEAVHVVTAEGVVAAVDQITNLFNALNVTEEILITGVSLKRG